MALILRIVKGPNVKKLLSVLTLAALVVPALPASAAVTTFSTQTVDVNWNTTASGTMTLYADYASGATLCGSEATGCGTPAVLTNAGSGTGTCTAAPTAPTANTGAAGSSTGVFFGNISPDLTTNNTECYYKDAVDAVFSTNDASGYKVYEGYTASTNAANYWLCYAANGTLPTASATGSAVAAAPSGFTATGAIAACPTGMTQVTNQTAAGPPPTGAVAAVSAASTVSNGHAGEDYALVVPALAPAGAAQFVITYTLVGN
jgi:hypothetical protein